MLAILAVVGSLLASAAFATGTEPNDTYQEVVSRDSPVAQFRFDDSSGSSSLSDSVGGPSASVSNVLLGGSGPFAGSEAGEFDGEAYATLASNPLSGDSNFSIEVWVNWARTTTTFGQPILELGDGPSTYISLTPASTATGHPMAFEIADSGTGYVLTAPELGPDVWNDVVVTEDRETLTLYVNGEKTASKAGVGSNPATLGTLEDDYFGASHDGAVPRFEGSLSNVSFYGSALSEEQVHAHYQAAQLPPAGGSLPTIEGDPAVGQTLDVSAGGSGETVAESDLQFQWERCNAGGESCEDLPEGHGSEYEVQSADVGGTLRVVVSHGEGAEKESATSPPTAVVAPAVTLVDHSSPTIHGTTQVGHTLSAEAGSWTGEGTITYTYQWQRCDPDETSCADIPAAQESTYTLRGGDVGLRPRVVVTAQDDNGQVSAASQPASIISGAESPVLTAPPVISGALQQGQTLEVSDGGWESETTPTYGYQWERCDAEGIDCEAISGATNHTYVPAKADVGSALRTVVTATTSGGSASAITAASEAVSPAALKNTAPPTISGDLHVAHVLTGTDGVWSSSSAITYTYQWQRCATSGDSCTSLPGAAASTYETTTGDIGHWMRLLVTAHSTWGEATVPSSPTAGSIEPAAPADETAPDITGANTESAELTAHTGTWSGGAPISYSYQWKRCNAGGTECAAIAGANAAHYIATSSDIGHALVVEITASSPWGEASATSPATPAIVAVAPTNTEEPWIFGSAAEGELLEAEPGAWTSTSSLTYTYQWQRCNEEHEECTNIEGATNSGYLVRKDDVGSTLQVVVTADAGGSEASDTAKLWGAVMSAGWSPEAPAQVSAPWVQGAGMVGEALSVHPGQWSGEAPITFTYQWQRCNEEHEECVDISGATATTYTVSEDDFEHRIQVRVTATNEFGDASSTAWLYGSIGELEPHNGPPVMLSEPWIEGEPVIGETVTAHPGVWGGKEPISFTYQWQRCNEEHEECAAIEGATTASYTLSESDLHHRVQVEVTATNEASESSDVEWLFGEPEAITPHEEGAPENKEGPLVHGSPTVGATEVVSASGTWVGEAPITLRYQWQRCNEEHEECTNIEGATGMTYEVEPEDIGHTLQVLVTASNASGEASSEGWVFGGPVVAAGAPTIVREPAIHGEQRVDEAQVASPGVWRGSTPITYTYQWQRCAGFFEEECTDIAGATEAEYVPNGGDIGYRLQALITASDAAGEATATAYDYGGPVIEGEADGTAPTEVAVPEVHGKPAIGALLTAAKGRWSGEQPIDYAYQWQRCNAEQEDCEDLSGATERIYRTTAEDGGHSLQVVITATNSLGSSSATAWLWGDTLPLAGRLVNTRPPSISAELYAGATATVNPGEWEGAQPITFSYQWERCTETWQECEPIAGAIDASYTIAPEDEHHRLQVEVKASNSVGEASETASLFGEIEAPEPTEPIVEEAPSVSGEAIDGHALNASEGRWTGPRPQTYEYQWQRCNSEGEDCSNIAGADNPGYALSDADLGSRVRVVVTATHGSSQTAAPSTPTSAVVAGPPVGEVPTISFARYPGETIDLESATARGAGPISEDYQWQLCESAESERCADIEGATGTTLKLTEEAVGKSPRLEVTFYNELGSDTEYSSPDATIVDHAPLNVEAPAIGAPETGLGEGDTATGASGAWVGSEPITIDYQWQRCEYGTCSDIGGATEASYTVPFANASLRLKVTGSNSQGTATAYSSTTPVYPSGKPVLVHPPTVTGEAVEGETLRVSTGAWHNNPTEFTYAWLQCRRAREDCTPIPEATSASYVPSIEQSREYLMAEVTASSPAGTASASTAAVGPVRDTPPLNVEQPSISGEPIVGNELSATAGTWTNNSNLAFSASYQYQWELCDAGGEGCAPIEGEEATQSNYTAPSIDLGRTLRVTVTTTSPGGENRTGAHSGATPALEAAVPVEDTKAPAIVGTAQDGEALSGTAGTWTGSPTIRYTYQWEDCDSEGAVCVAVPGATAPEHVLTRDEVGKTVRLAVTAANGAGAATSHSLPSELVKAASVPTNTDPPHLPIFYEHWAGEAEYSVYQHVEPEPGVWTGDPTLSYQWERCDSNEPASPSCRAIPDATEETYEIRPADVGYYLRLTETATNAAGSATAQTELAKSAVAAPGIEYEHAPGPIGELRHGGTYSGAAVPGQTITAISTATARYELPLTTTYEFQRVNEGAENTVLQTGSSPNYAVTAEDLGHEIAIIMTIDEWRADDAVVVGSLTIAAYTHIVEDGPTNTSAPTVTGELIAGKTLTAATGSWTGGAGELAYTYEWQRCSTEGEACEAISGATSATYTTTKADTGHPLRVRVTASNQGVSGTATSERTGTVAAAEPPTNTSFPTVTGETTDQDTLTASTGTWIGTSPISYSYQWLTCKAGAEVCEPIEGATAATYLLNRGEVRMTLQVEVTASNAAGRVSMLSAATEPVALAGRPVSVTLPSVMMLGFEQPGGVAVAEPGEWEHLTTTELQSLGYQWQRCDAALTECEDIEGATDARTIITAADAGWRLRVAVTAENESGPTTAISEPTGVVGGAEGEEPPPEEDSSQEEQEAAAPEGEVAGQSEEIVYTTSEDLYAATLEGTRPTKLTDCAQLSEELGTSVCELAHPVASSDNTAIVVEVVTGGSHRLVLMNSGGGDPRLLPGEAEAPALSAKAELLTYTRPASAANGQVGPELATMALGGSAGQSALATGIPITEDAAYSPDGTALAFLGKQTTSEAWHLYVAEADGEEPEELATGELSEVAAPVFSSSSKDVYVAAVPGPLAFNPEEHGPEKPPGVRAIYQVSVEGGGVEKLPIDDKSGYEEVREAAPLPDDKIAASVSAIVVLNYGDGFSVDHKPPELALFSTATGDQEIGVAEPPDHKPVTGVTVRLKGPRARTAFVQACRLPHKVCGTWNHRNTEEANIYAAIFAFYPNEENYYTFSDDCTDYVSQLLHESGMKMLGAYEEVPYAWWARTHHTSRLIEKIFDTDDTETWSVAPKLYHELRDTGLARALEYGEKIFAGDLLFFNWKLEAPKINHVGMIVSGNSDDPEHEIYTQHTPARYWSWHREEKAIVEYMSEHFGLKTSEAARGWEMSPLRPVHLGTIIPPE